MFPYCLPYDEETSKKKRVEKINDFLNNNIYNMVKSRGRVPSYDLKGEKRVILKNLRFSQNEWKLVHKKMAEAEICEFSEYARLACLQVSPILLDSEGLHLLAEIQQNMANFNTMMQLLESLTSRLKC